MNRPKGTLVAILIVASVAILVVGGNLWAISGRVPPSKDMQQAAYRQGQVDGSLFWDKDTWVAWSVPGMDGHEWTCRVHLDWILDPDFFSSDFYECSPWPWAGWLRRGLYGPPAPVP
jgi:hypothetical protein